MSVTQTQIDRALGMFALGASVAAVANAIGVCWETSQRIKDGKCRPTSRGPRAGKARYDRCDKYPRPPFDTKRVVRCKGCGALVHPPCLACALGFEGSSVGTSERRYGARRERLRSGGSACVAEVF